MAINNPYLPIKVITNGVLDTFAFNWSLTQAQDIKVYFEDSRGVKTLVDTGDYTLQRNTGENGGNIIFNTPPITGQTLIIEREDEKTQEKEFSNTKTFNLKYFQDALDKLTRWCQEQDYKIGQAIKIPETAVSDEEDPIDIWNRIILSDTGESIKYAKIENGNLYVKSSTGSWIMMPKSSNIRQVRQRVEYIDSQPIYIFEYTLNGTDWFDMGDISLYKQHKNLKGRDEADQHPASAITGVAEHIADKNNPHSVTKTQVGLGNVDNTSDADKPISDATQDALDLKADDNSVVHLSGNETIADVKTFSSFPVTPSSAPTTDYEVANKKYVDDNAGGGGSGSSLSAGQILFGLYDELPSAAYVWGDAGKQELNNASTNYSNLVDNITGGLIPSDTIAAWDAAYAANPDNAVPFWGYDSATDKVIVPNIPLRNDQIQMRVLFYVGAEVSPQTASQITAANVLSELHSKLDKPSTWSNDDFASMRNAIQGVDWTDAKAISVTTSNVAIGYDGLLVGYINAPGATAGYLYINDIEVTREGGDFAVIQMFVKSTDLIRGSIAGGAFKVIPYNYATGTNNLILGINYYGKFATTGDLDTASASLIETPLGKGRWALVGNDIDGYVRYYTVPTDGSFSEFTWEEGAPDTTDGDYVVETATGLTGTGYTDGWYRKYKSGWVEQGGRGKDTITLPVEMASSTYYCLATRRSESADSYCSIIELSATQISVKITTGTAAFWEVKGMAA